MGGAVALFALFEFETAACLKQLDEVVGSVTAWIEITVVSAQIERYPGDECPAIFVGDVSVGAQ